MSTDIIRYLKKYKVTTLCNCYFTSAFLLVEYCNYFRQDSGGTKTYVQVSVPIVILKFLIINNNVIQ